MKILTIDTSTEACSVALTIDQKLVSERLLNLQSTLTKRLLYLVETVLTDAGITVAALDGIGVALGPGSFTGLRVGVATAKGLSLATGVPAVGFSSLALLAMNLPWAGWPVCPLFDARKKEVYAGFYRCTDIPSALRDDMVLAPEAVAGFLDGPTILVGPGALRYREELQQALGDLAIFPPSVAHVPRASAAAASTMALLQSGVKIPLEELNPCYIRKSEAELARLQRETP